MAIVENNLFKENIPEFKEMKHLCLLRKPLSLENKEPFLENFAGFEDNISGLLHIFLLCGENISEFGETKYPLWEKSSQNNPKSRAKWEK